MTKHAPSNPDLPVVKALRILKRQEERAINLKMTPHTASHHLEKKQVEPTSSSANNPYAFPSQQISSQETTSTYQSVSPSSAEMTQTQGSWSTTTSWTSSWSGSNSGYPSATAVANNVDDSSTTDSAQNNTNAAGSSNDSGPSGTVSADNPITTMVAEDPSQMGTIYTIDVSVDGVQLPVHIDTGSSQFWAAHSSCEECKQNGMTTIDTALPPDCGQGDNTITITYAMGWVKGCHVNTSITLGEDTLQNYPVLAVIEAGGGTEKLGDYYSGLIGLASDGSSQDSIPTVVSALYRQGSIQQPIVGFYLPRAGENQESEITFGDPSTSEHADESKVAYLARQGGANGLYIVRMDSFVIGSETVSLGADCYLDTGSSGIAVPQSALEQVYQTAYGISSTNSTEKAPCQAPNSNTGVWITFAGTPFEIPYQDLIYDNGNKTCSPLIASYSGSVSDIWLFGDAFLHNVYHSVNVETGEVELFGLKNP
ncbi:hypothetical protein I302_108340 [Kwoniella bestiolae CBS 10118]|uniref:Peptidase A1 domain-containing protein n=1 Tax=Kwoniella bestiolae CBS 10118 TaxID=1296100 RepID=A0A1B9FVY9_9TREE|nr:hypothetical protein I302_07289 [Kwoniella bestiolae CBS 10118]OCF22939.1 hypothetical protein I302_07289 [Kwoniella bestiolae CBS 10118]